MALRETAKPQTGRALHPVDREIAVRFESVFFSYGNTAVLEGVSFHIHRGEFVALVGPNGSGKTTILKLLLGLEQPVSGKIELSGETGYVPQQPPSDQAFPITVRDVVRMGLLRRFGRYAAREKTAVDAALEQAGISSLAGRSYRALSGGQRRRVLLARALAACPEIFILDEPTANMDSESEQQLFQTLGNLKGKATILIVTHDTDFVSALTSRVLCLGTDENNRRGMVQHRIEAAGAGERHGDSVTREARVLHSENFPADDCYE